MSLIFVLPSKFRNGWSEMRARACAIPSSSGRTSVYIRGTKGYRDRNISAEAEPGHNQRGPADELDRYRSPQGNLAGHGISVGQTFCASYFAEEFGLIMGIMSVMPKPAYQQGLDEQWLRQTRYDFYFPEFANLSEQAIERSNSTHLP